MDSRSNAADIFTPTSADELARFVADNAAGSRRPLFPVGGRTALHYGYPRADADVTLAMGGLDRVVDYPARDMTITLEAGTRIVDLQKQLAAEGQRLPIDIPQAHRATIGGAIATNTSGPGRFGHGTFRDYVIGISAIDGVGRLFSAGGRVVKNVAGYDLCKLLVGSMGTLAVITQVTLKLRPLAASRTCVWSAFGQPQDIDAVLDRLMTSETRPMAIEVLNPAAVHQIQRESKADVPVDRWVLCVAFEGSTAETDWQAAQLQSEIKPFSPESIVVVSGDEAGRLWTALTEYQAASDDPLTFQVSLPPSDLMRFLEQATQIEAAVQCHAGNGIVVGHLADHCSSVDEAASVLNRLRDATIATDGSLIVLACDNDWKPQLSLFGPPQPSAGLDQRVKAALDPHNLLSPGRLGVT